MVRLQGFRTHHRSVLLGTVAALGAFGVGSSAIAADAAVELDTVLVTAQKRSEKLEDIPASITAVSSEQLAARGMTDTLSIQHATPGVVFGLAGSWSNFYMRGLGNTLASAAAQSPVAFYIDGVYQADPSSTAFGLDNIDHVEILKGPQGTLYGRNAVGGAINIITKAPTSGVQVKLKASLGNYDEQNYGGYVNVGSERVQANLAVNRHKQDGWYKNIAPGARDLNSTDDFSLRGKLRLKPTDNVDLTLAADYMKQEGWGQAAGLLPVDPAHGVVATAIAYGAVAHVPVAVTYDPWRTSMGSDLSTSAVNTGLALTGRVNLPGVDFVSITAYRDFRIKHGVDIDATNLLASFFRTSDRHTQFTQELQLISTEGERFSWVAGLYYLYDDAGFAPLQLNSFARFGGVNVEVLSKLKNHSYAAYGEGTYKLTDQFSVVLGARYSKDKLNHYAASQTATLGAAPSVVVGRVNSAGNKANFSAFSPRLTLKYQRPEGLYYATASKGYAAGLYNLSVIAPTAARDLPVRPTRVNAFEGGAKWVLMDRRLFVNVAAFHYDAKNLQIQNKDSNAQTSFENADGKIDGLDADAEWRATRSFTVRAAFEVLNARYGAYPKASVWVPNLNQGVLTVPPCGGKPKATPFDSACAVTIDLSGERMIRSPKFTSTVGFDWDLPVPESIGTLSLTSDWYHSSRYRTTSNATIVSPSYDMFNASLNYKPPNGQWSASLWGKNINNAKYFTTGGETSFGRQVGYGAPRMYGVTVTYQFES